jgi:uncharacterized cupin superfamily protein
VPRIIPVSDWFVLNARNAEWIDSPFGKYCGFERKDARFEQLGINLNVLEPGEPMTMYHREGEQEDFLVLEGECLLIVEGQEYALRKWDLFHCPPGVAHVIVGAGDRRSLVLAVGARSGAKGLVYPADPTARRHRAARDAETADPKVAYEGITFERGPYKEGWLPD